MPKRLDQMNTLERADIRYRAFEMREEMHQRREQFWKITDYGVLVISLIVAAAALIWR